MFNSIQKKIEAEKMMTKIVEINEHNVAYGKTMGKLRNRINVKLVSNKKGYLKWTSKPGYYVTENIWQLFNCDT